MKFKKILLGTLAGIMLTTSVSAEINDESLYFDIILDYASTLYLDDTITTDDLKQEAIEGVLKDNPELMYAMIKAAYASLDEYSEFYTAEEYEQQFQRINRVFYGMGVLIQLDGGNMSIIQVQDGGGAKAAGILEGDIIIAVDGVSVIGYSLDEVVNMVAGEEGTFVSVKILRNGTEMDFYVERKMVSQTTVGYAILENNIGYLEIMSFSDSTPGEVVEALTAFNENGITDVILDLRDNPGGILESVVSVANMMVPEGAIMHTIYRDEIRNTTYNSYNRAPRYKFAVLVNGNTASSAEVLAGALQDSKVGYLIGENTFGKALIQEIYQLPTGDAIKLTTGHYLTRDGHDIQSIGITPDEFVTNRIEKIDTSEYEKFDYVIKWKRGDVGTGVLAAKQMLNVLGYYSGTIDDEFDYMLERAVYKFQESTGLYPYGVIDYATQGTIESEFSKVDVMYDIQFDMAYSYFTESN